MVSARDAAEISATLHRPEGRAYFNDARAEGLSLIEHCQRVLTADFRLIVDTIWSYPTEGPFNLQPTVATPEAGRDRPSRA
jgi:hypothetical protein